MLEAIIAIPPSSSVTVISLLGFVFYRAAGALEAVALLTLILEEFLVNGIVSFKFLRKGVKEFEARWIGWAGVNVPDEIGQKALTKALAEKVHMLICTHPCSDTHLMHTKFAGKPLSVLDGILVAIKIHTHIILCACHVELELFLHIWDCRSQFVKLRSQFPM
ncbi:hypothetical protein RIF29_28508 [Crotalaria pallida]|uniref:Uncharacterized protein n=1 Tax=Crotalaria pallida TaxID=3830 RepID=A0AAN9EI27_CROPI